jgi:hypothetical protein
MILDMNYQNKIALIILGELLAKAITEKGFLVVIFSVKLHYISA